MNTNTTDDAFKNAMARFTNGVTAVTTADNGAPAGLIATSVCSLSADPPTVIVCVNKHASSHDAILRSRFFAVNLLAADQKDVAQRFASAKGAARFDPAQWTVGKTGAPILTGSVVSLDCNVIATHNGYSHTIFVGEITASITHPNASANCLLWHQRNFAAAAVAAA
ncbi:flavin reductase family protein [Paraburkholderia phosphatilytica]|uniref:flavin reductase family protein n=1 Tax=Paraburkholderia phosphatilytica TaxID=2282883 RepID=UPI000E544593|nr:flavin reductase family protein [Paraburkholderia phosphatilytica]